MYTQRAPFAGAASNKVPRSPVNLWSGHLVLLSCLPVDVYAAHELAAQAQNMFRKSSTPHSTPTPVHPHTLPFLSVYGFTET